MTNNLKIHILPNAMMMVVFIGEHTFVGEQDWLSFMIEGNYVSDSREVMSFYEDFTAEYTLEDLYDRTINKADDFVSI